MQGASIVAALVAVFSVTGGDHPLGLFYLLFLPLIWIATRHGLPAATWAVLAIQIGLIAGLQVQGHSEPTLRAFRKGPFDQMVQGDGRRRDDQSVGRIRDQGP
jgi:hypothetical protein